MFEGKLSPLCTHCYANRLHLTASERNIQYIDSYPYNEANDTLIIEGVEMGRLAYEQYFKAST